MIAKIIKSLIRFYQLAISPNLPKSCRFEPTCSSYAIQAIDKHGALKGIYLALRRITRCTPWNKHKHFDPVPDEFSWRKKDSAND